MKRLIEKYPGVEKELRELYNLQESHKGLRKIEIPNKPIGDRKLSIPNHLKHFINVVHLRLTAQLDLLIVGIERQNPEIFSVARGYMETVAALAYVSSEVEKKYNNKEFDEAWLILYKATMGGRTFPFNTEDKTVFKPRSFNILDYVDKADKLLTNELKKLPSRKSVNKMLKSS